MYFVDEEFACPCKKCQKKPKGNVSPVLKERLEELRERWGHPVYVTSGYRCPEHNKEVGGVENSFHTQGLAADICVEGDYEEFYRFVKRCRLFDGVGEYPLTQFVHVDVRDAGCNPNRYQWTS